MTEQQRRCRAEFIHTAPALWFALLYLANFFGCSAAIDLIACLTGSGMSDAWQYVFPVALTATPWIGVRGWARRELARWTPAEA